MKSVAVVLMVTVLAPSICAASPYAQTIAREAVEQLPAGARLRLVLTDGSIAIGKLVRVESDAITLEDASFPLAAIASVEEVPQKRMSPMAMVFTIGAIAGGVVVGYYLWLLANSQ